MLTKYAAVILLMFVAVVQGQAQEALQQPQLAIDRIRKTVTFIRLNCSKGNQVHDVRGTAFFVVYPEKRLGEKAGFGYLVTNRHVALCWDDEGRAMKVNSVKLWLNRRHPSDGRFSQEVVLNPNGNLQWILPPDESIDLAVVPMLPDNNQFDFMPIPTSSFASKDELVKESIGVGYQMFFTGFFYQFPGTRRIEPIVRQGIIAMMPDELIPFVGQPAHLYLADVHVFGGNKAHDFPKSTCFFRLF
jgi:hypothetical protein